MTVIRRLMSDDRPMLDAFLECHRASSMFLRSNLFYSGLIDGPDRFHGLYMGVFEGGALTDVAAHYWNNNIILQAPTMPMELAYAVAKESGRTVNGVLGPWAQVKAAEPGLDLDRTRLGKVVPEYLYLLSLDEMVVPEPLSSEAVTHRRAGHHDLMYGGRVVLQNDEICHCQGGSPSSDATRTCRSGAVVVKEALHRTQLILVDLVRDLPHDQITAVGAGDAEGGALPVDDEFGLVC